MPNIKSAKKRIKTSEKRREKNKAVKSAVGTARTKLDKAISDGNKEAAMKLFSAYCSAVDKSAKTGALNRTAASRKKSRAAARLAAVK